ncbi:MAG: hypothetical protein RMY16_32600 [Nostoc sp. DedQUE12b]|uniref:hypothetical protein n=1 Tax=Nostoc sp. DedQUE12b TaxID=3075398 RepID=UPI002AD397F8|nr:hypothetical protein [Nostoc sp. DedQUE12b]MDZ8090256.1 hypothetical protein [Nostoc sp. DedQUE12b]
MRLFADELGRFDYLLHILNNLLRFVKYFQKKLSLGIYAPTENPQTFEKAGTLGDITLDFRLRLTSTPAPSSEVEMLGTSRSVERFWIMKNALYSLIRCWLLGYGLYTHFL